MKAPGVEAEIQAFRDLETRATGQTLQEAGFQFICHAGVMPPNNRVTRCFGRRLDDIISHRNARRALDLGTGTGILALIAARHCAHVIGVDLDPQAVACARANAALNGVTNVEFRVGNAFEPVEEIGFDLIFSNPPFYPSPDQPAGPPAVCIQAETNLLAALAGGALKHLAPGGRALFVTSSLTPNEPIHSLLEGRIYSCSLLEHGKGGSQDLFLWEIIKPC
jgi:methylase of polypeptide subunit release factors